MVPKPLVYGGIAALGMIGVTVVTWKNGMDAFLSMGAYSMYIFPVDLAIVATLAEKKRRNGVLSFREALKPAFGTIVVALVIHAIFTLVLVKWIDPGFGRKLPDAVAAKMEATYRRFGVPEDEIAGAVADQKKSDPFGFGATFWGLAQKCIVGFVISALIAAIIGQRLPKPGQKR